MKRSKLKIAKDKAWKVFSLYIRTKYSKDGICTCITCDKEYPIKEIQAGHGIGGRGNSILLCEEAVRPQCFYCNIRQNGRYDVYAGKLIELYGADGYQELLKLKNTPKKMKEHDWIDEYNYYKEALEEL